MKDKLAEHDVVNDWNQVGLKKFFKEGNCERIAL